MQNCVVVVVVGNVVTAPTSPRAKWVCPHWAHLGPNLLNARCVLLNGTKLFTNNSVLHGMLHVAYNTVDSDTVTK